MGGQSAEREVSLKSGTAVLAALTRQGVDAHAFDPARRSLGDLAMAEFDRVFIALHGRFGEDGCMQGALELLHIHQLARNKENTRLIKQNILLTF